MAPQRQSSNHFPLIYHCCVCVCGGGVFTAMSDFRAPFRADSTDSLSASKSFVVRSSNVKTKRLVDSRYMVALWNSLPGNGLQPAYKKKNGITLKSKEHAAEVWAVIFCVWNSDNANDLGTNCSSIHAKIGQREIASKDS